ADAGDRRADAVPQHPGVEEAGQDPPGAGRAQQRRRGGGEGAGDGPGGGAEAGEQGRGGRGEVRNLRPTDWVRLRPGRCLGRCDRWGLHVLLEVGLDALTESGGNSVRRLDVTLRADRGCQVAEDGPGLPPETASLLTTPGTSHSLGLFIVNAL